MEEEWIKPYQIYNGDCLELMKDIKDKSVDMILCDLPYGCLNKSNKNAKWDNIIPFEYLWSAYTRIIKDNGCIALFGQGIFSAQLICSNLNLYRYDLIWDEKLTSGFLNAKRQPLRKHEQIAIFYKKQPIYNPIFTNGKPLHSKGNIYLTKENTNNNYGKFLPIEDNGKDNTLKYPTSILSFQKPHPSISIHPTQKPVALLEYLIKTYTNENEIVLDNCMGSGSTGVGCLNTNRKFIGIELDKNCFNIAKDRIENTYSKLKTNLDK